MPKFRKKRVEKPTLGVKPFWLVREERMFELASAMRRRIEAGQTFPKEWLAEFQSLTACKNPETI